MQPQPDARPEHADAPPAVELRSAWKVFGRRAEEAMRRLQDGEDRAAVQRATRAVPAVIDASLAVAPGEIFVVMGLSGSGKSTLVRMINRLFEPTAGRILIDGTDITDAPAPELRQVRARSISMVFQHFALFPHRSVLENAAYGLSTQGVPKPERLERARASLELVGLGDWGDSYPTELSGGMRQRVGLARAFTTDAPILLMDEAFSALDPLIKREMQDQLIELQQRLHRTIVFITHDLNEAMRLGDRIAVLRDGRIVQVGTSEQILSEPANDYVASFVQDVDRARVLTARSAMVEPAARISEREGAAAAMARMRELQVSSLFVLGPERKLLGAVHDAQVAEAMRRKEHRLEAVLDQRVTSTGPDTPLSELFAPSLESTLPMAVVDDDGRLLGVLPRVSLLAAMADAEPDPTREPTLPSPGNGDRPAASDRPGAGHLQVPAEEVTSDP